MTPLKDKVQDTLDECRMLILGGQVLISAMAESVLEPGFHELTVTAQAACAMGMPALVLAVVLLMWPAAYHRVVCRGMDRVRLQEFATRVLCIALLPFGTGLAATLYVVGARVSGALAGTALAASVGCVALFAWYGLPMLARRRSGPRNRLMNTQEPDTALSDKVRHVLTEARMVLPGAQALLGFGAIAVLMDAFKTLSPTLKVVHTVGLCWIALAVVLLMTPAAYHRIAEHGEHSERFHAVATRLLLCAMAALAPGLAAATWIVLEQATGSRAAGIAAAACVMLVAYGAWFGWTALLRWNDRKRVSSRQSQRRGAKT